MNKKSQNHVIQSYRKRSARYDFTVGIFNMFSSFGFDIPAWRLKAVQALALKPGDTVVDIGCGTGLNIPFLQAAIGPEGKIIGVDLSQTMLDQAQQRVLENDWKNVELVCSDAAKYDFPTDVDGILSTFALILVPDVGRAVVNGCQALKSGGRLSVLDMLWPDRYSIRWRHLFFWLRPLGVTRETLERRAWETVWKTMDEHLINITRRKFWYGFMYMTSGVRETHQSRQ